jgi:8-amino-7-oxononanoate synthase
VKQETPAALGFLDRAIADAEQHELLRARVPPGSESGPSFCSNDYLGLATRPPPRRPSGAGASRLVAGESVEHAELEAASAELVGLPTALAFSSGYAANVGLIGALAGPSDLIVSDALNHASLIDGCRLYRARVLVEPQHDAGAVERALSHPRAGHAFVLTESYFSMDADAPDLGALRAICDAHGAALIVDEAHALGVLGPEGRGLCAEFGVRGDAIVGTYGKAFGAAGAFVAGCPALTTWLWNRARSFVFSTGLSPAIAAAAGAAMQSARDEPERRESVLALSTYFRRGLGEVGVRPVGFGHIVPWVVGDTRRALRLAAALRAAGIAIRAIRPPSVPEGAARLRFTVTAALRVADLDRAVAAVATALATHPV